MLRELREFNLPKLEEKILSLWEKNNIFVESLKRREGHQAFRFYEGPPYLNGLPGIHHVLSRIFKDVILRYRAMRGYFVPRRGGWDTHGLPVELSTEKELGIKMKSDIEKLGVEKFNKKAREIISRYQDDWDRFTERIGFWLDLKNAYLTYNNSYIESLWWVLKKISDRGYLKEFRKVLPYCPRCETPLSSHEMGQPDVYNLTKDPSAYVKLKLKEDTRSTSSGQEEYLLVWTTTPWTLPANVAVAVDPKLIYSKYKIGNEYLWTSNPPPKPSLEVEVVEKLSGRQLIGKKYEPLYKVRDYSPREGDFQIVAANFVKTDEGTGLVHVAPAFGEEDFELIGRDDFPVTVDDQGRVTGDLPGAGKFIKEADEDILDDLKKRGLIYLQTHLEHDYPFCWRCGTPIIYFARKSWFLEVSRLRRELARENEKINWIPAYIKHGRFGDWLSKAADWAISRERYWGTPLPIWRCSEGHLKVIGSLEELDKEDYSRNKFFILRHGEAEHNLKGILASGPEGEGRTSRLTEKGEREMEGLARRLAWKRINLIFTSPYLRTRETAEIIAKKTKAEVIIDKRLGEIRGGTFNWKPIAQYHSFFSSPIEEFRRTPEGGESLTEVKRRVLDFIRDINNRYQNKRILIVSHNAPLWMLEAVTKHLTDEEALNLRPIALGQWREIKLRNLPYTEDGEIDLHRPYVDRLYLRCRNCGGRMERVPDVADVWFDSGSMPWASIHYPFQNRELVRRGIAYPADFIAEAVDQTRGWFYTLLATAVLLGKPTPYMNVISLGLIHDKYGQKMSKSKGNVVEPSGVIDKYGVDAVRWYFYTINPPGEQKNFDETEVELVLRRFFLILYNCFKFYEMTKMNSSKMGGHDPTSPSLPAGEVGLAGAKHVLDKWLLSRLQETIGEATKNLEQYEIGTAARLIENLIDDLSRWYIRRSRRRAEMGKTLGLVLTEISKLVAPFTPFFSDALYLSVARLRGLDGLNSVHLEDWPKAEADLIDEELIQKMKKARGLAAMALAKRNAAGIKVRQPLAALKIRVSELKDEGELLEILKDEINVKEIIFDETLAEEIELDTEVTELLREEGIVRELVRLIQNLRRGAGLEPRNKINLYLRAPGLITIVLRHQKLLSGEVNAAVIEFKRIDKFDAEISTKIEGEEIWIGLRKA